MISSMLYFVSILHGTFLQVPRTRFPIFENIYIWEMAVGLYTNLDSNIVRSQHDAVSFIIP